MGNPKPTLRRRAQPETTSDSRSARRLAGWARISPAEDHGARATRATTGITTKTSKAAPPHRCEQSGTQASAGTAGMPSGGVRCHRSQGSQDLTTGGTVVG